MFNSGVAQGVKDKDEDEAPVKDNSVEEDSSGRSCEGIEAERRNSDDDNPLHQLPDRSGRDPIADPQAFSDEQNNTAPNDTVSPSLPSDLSPTNLHTHADTAHSRGGTSLAAEEHAAISELYQATGKNLEWKEAVETATQPQMTEQDEIEAIKLRKRKRYRYKKEIRKRGVGVPSVEALAHALWHEEKSNQYIFRLYRDMPVPGVSYLSKKTRGELLRRFAKPPDRRWSHARRYLSLVQDMVDAKLKMSRSLWTSAINLSGRATSPVRKKYVLGAIGLWRQMEHVAGVESDDVVFNILVDIAAKAGQYTVADRLLGEMNKRGLSFDRCGKVVMIYYYGLRQDVDGLCKAYDDFVNSGEFVDTVTLNCLIVAFLRAGEVKTAEQLYRRMMQAQANVMKKLNPGPDGTGPHWPAMSSELNIYRKRTQKLGRLLKASAVLSNTLPNHHAALQNALPMIPDTRTFHILLKFHAHQTGNLQGFMSVLADMENTFAVPPRSMIYLLLFEGFARHGRRKKTWWSAERLQEAWRAYLRALYESKHRLDERYLPQQRKIIWENPLASTAATQTLTSRRPRDDAPSGLYAPLPSNDSSPGVETTSEEIQSEHSESQAEERKDEDQSIEEDQEKTKEKGQPEGKEADEDKDQDPDEDEDENKENDDGDSIVEELESELDAEELFGNPAQIQQEPQADELKELERRIENGVFLGRSMIIVILGAFGTCCGPQQVMDVWMIMEKIWQPQKRRTLDVLAVQEELEKQMNRTRGGR